VAELYAEPTTVDETIEALGQLGPDAAIVAGGTDVVVGARSGKRALPEALVAIHRVAQLDGLAGGADEPLRLGALVTHATLEREPLVRARYSALSDAAALVGSPATRHVGTLGGNLANASPAMETGSPLLVLDATVELASPAGRRTLSLADFILGPAKTALEEVELVAAVHVPEPPPRSGTAYLRLEYRRAMEIAVVGAAAFVVLDNGAIADARVALTAVAPTCVRAPATEEVLRDREPAEAVLAEAAAASAAHAKPIDDVRAAADYRRAMVPVIVRRALERAVARAREAQ
jgi:aerobic carbon-monoxide dehydrogenase medium subunit